MPMVYWNRSLKDSQRVPGRLHLAMYTYSNWIYNLRSRDFPSELPAFKWQKSMTQYFIHSKLTSVPQLILKLQWPSRSRSLQYHSLIYCRCKNSQWPCKGSAYSCLKTRISTPNSCRTVMCFSNALIDIQYQYQIKTIDILYHIS